MNGNGVFGAFHARVRQSTESFLARAFEACGETTVCQAAHYASMNGGHRWRAMAGSEEAARRAERYREEALDVLSPFGMEADLFRSLIARACCVDR